MRWGGGGCFVRTRFTAGDVDVANAAWGLNCGPAALAAICELTLDEARKHFERERPFPGYTNPTLMFAALRSTGRRYNAVSAAHWPNYGLARIQWEGPWTQPGVPIRARYRYTHWVGAATATHGVGVFDVNALSNGSGWCALADWSAVLVPALTVDIRRATGGWHITHAIEVERPKEAV